MVVIGITPSLDDQGMMYVNRDYIQSVLRAGAAPAVLPLTEDEHVQIALLTRLDGLLLSGGPDVDPVLYGEEKLPCCGEILAVRDAMAIMAFPPFESFAPRTKSSCPPAPVYGIFPANFRADPG